MKILNFELDLIYHPRAQSARDVFCFQNMFLAIINDAYAEVKAEMEARRANFLVEDYFKKGYSNVLSKVTGTSINRGDDIARALQAAYADDEKVTYEEVRQNLKKYVTNSDLFKLKIRAF